MKTIRTFNRPHRAAVANGLALLLSGCDQIRMARLYFANEGTDAVLEQALPLTLPFREDRGWVIVQASVNGAAPVDFVLDTGASMLAVLEGPRTRGLGLDMHAMERIGEGLAAITAAVQPSVDIDFGPLTLPGQTVLAIPVASLKCSEEIPEPPFQGVVGHELFSRYVVEINYDRGQVVLHDPETYRYEGAGRIVPAEISSRQPYVQADVAAPDGRRYQARLHVDSGANIDLSLFPKTHADIVAPAQGPSRNACFVGGLASYRTGSSVDIGLGEGPAITTPAEYALGDEVIDTGQNGRLGSRFLSRHNVVFDYSRGQMILEPRAAASEAVAAQGAGASLR
ncbi:aspartyl protease family protein [Arenimonas terrae]|uniref:Peptidase A2 domain-containing protein n=1 Tax=Arenimonas terrae TaxID=2546226 RepID=A0A5C4RWE9_9GAMM|nr:aspartyl protease family protein [Arenimonas terrae]TNJ35017.1 hypothetical protein E1B00_04365 [Arenimonas terrae]